MAALDTFNSAAASTSIEIDAALKGEGSKERENCLVVVNRCETLANAMLVKLRDFAFSDNASEQQLSVINEAIGWVREGLAAESAHGYFSAFMRVRQVLKRRGTLDDWLGKDQAVLLLQCLRALALQPIAVDDADGVRGSTDAQVFTLHTPSGSTSTVHIVCRSDATLRQFSDLAAEGHVCVPSMGRSVAERKNKHRYLTLALDTDPNVPLPLSHSLCAGQRYICSVTGKSNAGKGAKGGKRDAGKERDRDGRTERDRGGKGGRNERDRGGKGGRNERDRGGKGGRNERDRDGRTERDRGGKGGLTRPGPSRRDRRDLRRDSRDRPPPAEQWEP